MSDISHTAILGAGVIGASWAALFLAAGRSVTVYDPAPNSEEQTRAFIETAWPTLEELGLTDRATPNALAFAETAASAVDGADFVQENVRVQKLLRDMQAKRVHLAVVQDEFGGTAHGDGAIFSSSLSSITATQRTTVVEEIGV